MDSYQLEVTLHATMHGCAVLPAMQAQYAQVVCKEHSMPLSVMLTMLHVWMVIQIQCIHACLLAELRKGTFAFEWSAFHIDTSVCCPD